MKMLKRTDVEVMIGLSRSTIYAGIAEGTFPKPIRVGRRAVRFLQSDIEQWIKDRSNG